MIQTSIVSAASASLSDQETAYVERLLAQLLAKRSRIATRQSYYDQKVLLKDLGISIPPQLRRMDSVLGWPAKTVDVVADRIQFEKFVHPEEGENPFGLDEIVEGNRFEAEFTQAVSSSLTHACAFVTVSKGDTSVGEPEILWLTRSAYSATGLWDRRRRALSAGLTVTGEDDGRITGMNLYLPDHFVQLSVRSDGRMISDIQPNRTGRTMMEVLATKPDLRRPFGRSRISRAVMSLTDSAIRTVVRSEISAEFFANPQRYLMGVDPEVLGGGKWDAVLSRMLVISRDEEGELPVMGQFPQMNMQPHTDQLRQWASLLASESSIPLDELGFPSDNPSSDSAISSQREPLRQHADRIIDGYRPALRSLAVSSLMLRDGESDASKYARLQSVFAPTVKVSEAAAADAVLKQVQAIPWLAGSSVTLERLGFDANEVRRLMVDKRRAEGGNMLDRVLAATAEPAAHAGGVLVGEPDEELEER